MKKLILSTLILITTIVASNAQFGVKAGVNLASLQQEGQDQTFESIEGGTVIGLQAGLVYRLPLVGNLYLQPELIFIQKGGAQDYEVPSLERQTNVETYYNYIEIPIMAQYYFASDASGFFVEGGPFIGFAANGKEDVKTVLAGVTFENTNDFNFDDQDNQKRVDYGVSFGLGYAITSNLVVNLRYNLGINNLIDDDAINTNDNDPKVSTRGLGLTLGYYF